MNTHLTPVYPTHTDLGTLVFVYTEAEARMVGLTTLRDSMQTAVEEFRNSPYDSNAVIMVIRGDYNDDPTFGIPVFRSNEVKSDTVSFFLQTDDFAKRVGPLPCPFCGDEAEVTTQGTFRRGHLVECTGCGCSLETGETWAANRSWNTRVPVEPMVTKAQYDADIRSALADVGRAMEEAGYNNAGDFIAEHLAITIPRKYTGQ